MTEAQFQAKLIRKLKKMFPGCVIQKMDSHYQQGFPDLLILWEKNWAVLEVKTSAEANIQPNQDYFVKQLADMSFAAYIYPEIEEEVLIALQQAFESPRRARIPES